MSKNTFNFPNFCGQFYRLLTLKNHVLGCGIDYLEASTYAILAFSKHTTSN